MELPLNYEDYKDYLENFDAEAELRKANGKDRKILADTYTRWGILPPDPNRGVLTSIGHTVLDTGNQLGLGFGRTIEELTGHAAMRQKFENEIASNPQYGPDEFYSPSSLKPAHVARTVTTGVTQSVGAIGAGMAGNLIGGPAGGLAAMGGFTFGQIYGDTVKDYREAMPGEDESVVKGLAFTSAVGQSLIESIIGPEKVIAGIGKGFFAETMKNTTRSLVKRMGAEALKGAISEGSEEVLQAYWDSLCKGVAAKEGLQLPGWEEVRDQFMGGALPGAVLGGIGGVRNADTANTRTNTDRHGSASAKATAGQARPRLRKITEFYGCLRRKRRFFHHNAPMHPSTAVFTP